MPGSLGREDMQRVGQMVHIARPARIGRRERVIVYRGRQPPLLVLDPRLPSHPSLDGRAFRPIRLTALTRLGLVIPARRPDTPGL